MTTSLLTKCFRICLFSLVLLCLMNIPANAASDWQQLYPSYPTHGYNDIYVAGTNAAFAVGDAGLISRFNGTSWTVMTSPVSNKLNSVWGRSASDVFAVGDNGTIIHYNGSSWQKMSSPTSKNLHSIWGFANPSDPVYAGGRDGNILKYAGGAWSFMETPLADGMWTFTIIYGIWGYSPGNLFAVGYKSGDSNEDVFLRCTDGSNWAEIPDFPAMGFRPTAIWGVSGGLLYIAGSDGIYTLTSGGSAWNKVLTDNNGITDIWGTSSNDIWAVGDSIYHFGGSSWSPVIFNVDPANQWGELNSVSGSSVSNVLAAGSSGRIQRYQGSAWSSMTTILEYPVQDLWHDSDTSLCAVGDNGLTLQSNGTNWTPMASATNKNLSAVCGWGNGHFLAAGAGGTVQYYNGSSWTLLTINIPITEDLHDAWCLGADSAIVVGANGKILYCGGTGCWVQVTDGTTANLYAVSSTTAGMLAAGEGGVLMKSNGTSWNKVNPTGPTLGTITDLWGDSLGNLIAISDNSIYSYNSVTPAWTLEHENPDATLHLRKLTGSTLSSLLAAGFSTATSSGVVLQRNGVFFPAIKTFPGYYAFTIQEGSLGKLFVGGAQQEQNSPWHGQILHYDGSAWTSMIETNGLQDIWGGDLDNVFVVGDSGTILHYDGTSVSPMESNTLLRLSAVFAGANASWACATGGAGGMIYFDGTTWSAGSNSSTEWMNDMWGAGDTVFAVGEGGTILKSLNQGADWIAETSPSTEGLNAVWGVSADGPIYAAGRNGTVLGFSNGGQWSAISSAAYSTIDLYGIWGLSASDIYIVGHNDSFLGSNETQIVHYNGSSWEKSFYSYNVQPAHYLSAVLGRSAKDVMAFGNPSLRKECTSNWETWSEPGIPPLRKVWGKADGAGNYHVFGISYYNSIYHYTIPANRDCSSPTLSSPWTLFLPAIITPKK